MFNYRVSLRRPSVEVRFKNLNVETEVYADLSRNLPSILNAYREAFEVLLSPSFSFFCSLVPFVGTLMSLVCTVAQNDVANIPFTSQSYKHTKPKYDDAES